MRIYSQAGVIDCNTYAIVAVIQLARDSGNNPEVPNWLENDYFRAIREQRGGFARFPYFPESWCQKYPADRVTASQSLKRVSHLHQGIGMTGKKAQPTIGNQAEQLRYACADLFRP